jgi:hypothetical protein
MNTEMPFLTPSIERSSPWTICTGQDTTEGWPSYHQFSAPIDWNHRNREFREFSPYQKVVRLSMPTPYIAGVDDCHARKTFSPSRPCGSRIGTVEERMSREVETFVCVFPAPAALKGQGIFTFYPGRRHRCLPHLLLERKLVLLFRLESEILMRTLMS